MQREEAAILFKAVLVIVGVFGGIIFLAASGLLEPLSILVTLLIVFFTWRSMSQAPNPSRRGTGEEPSGYRYDDHDDDDGGGE